MSKRLQDRWAQWQRSLVQSMLGYNQQDYAATRIMLLAGIGTVSLPLYYLVWRFFLRQDYESLVLRGIGMALCMVGLFARRFNQKALQIYLLIALSYVIPFFFTFMFLMNHASPVWTQSLLIGLITLFHFDMAVASLAYCIGTALACIAVIMAGNGDVLLSRPVLEQLPVHWFMIAVLSVVKVGRNVLAQEKLAGLGAGLATVAHELRTPLTSVDANVRGLTRLLQQAAAPVEVDKLSAQEALTRIQFEVRHMNHLIDLFLLSASAVDRNLRANEAVSMAAVVEAVLKRYPFVGGAQRKSVVVELRGNFVFAGQSELTVVILLNLLRNALNAIQRAGKGRVRIIVDGARGTPRLLFIDTGCGIAARHMPLIFQRFYSYPAHNGSGIGLALCKQIVEAWNARIRCVSRETAYAIFVLEFPQPVPAHFH